MARKEVKIYVCISDVSGEEFAEGQGATVTVAFDGGKTYTFDSTQEEAHAILAGVKSPQEVTSKGRKASSSKGDKPKRPSFGPKGARGKLDELKADVDAAKAWVEGKDADWFATALKNATAEVRADWDSFLASVR